MKTLGVVFYVSLLLVGGSIWRGYALSVLWGWFIATVFHLPGLRVVEAIGLSLVITAFTYDAKDVDSKDEDTSKPLIKGTINALLIPLLFLLFGWVVKQFM